MAVSPTTTISYPQNSPQSGDEQRYVRNTDHHRRDSSPRPEWIARHKITVMPIEIRFGDETFLVRLARIPWSFRSRWPKTRPNHLEISIPGAVAEAYAQLSRDARISWSFSAQEI